MTIELGCYLTISSSAASSPSALNLSQGLFQSQLLTSDGLSVGASASVLPLNSQGWLPLGLTGLNSLQSKGLWSVFSSTTIWKHQFFSTQPFLDFLCGSDSEEYVYNAGESESESKVAQSCLTLCNPMDYSLLGSSIHGIFQARVLEWGAIAFSKVVLCTI